MATGDSNAAPVVNLTDRQLVVEYPSFREFINLSAATLSEEGMFVEVQTPEPIGSRLSIVLRIVDGFQLVQGEAEVVAVREVAAGQSRAGMSIRFQDLDEPGERLLAKVIDSHRRQGEPLFVLDQPTPAVAEEAPVVIEADDSGGLEEEIPELAEIEASVRHGVRPPEPEAVPPSDQSFVNVDEASPPTLVTPPDDLAAAPPAQPVIAEPEISILDLPPVESQPPLPEPPPVELPEIGGMDVAPPDSEDVRWEEPVAISPPPATSFEPPPTAPPAPETRFTGELTDAPVPDELVVASGALKWPDESGAVGETDLGIAEPELSQRSYSTKRRSGRGLFLLLVVAILAGAAGYAYYMGLLQPYVDALTSTVASFIEGESGVEVSAPVELPPPIDESATEGAEAESTSPSTVATETPPVVPAARERREAVPVVSKLSRIERITWEELGGETLLMLWADDQVVGGQVELSRIEGEGARVIIKIYGVTRAPAESTLEVGTSHIQRIRAGLHREPQGSVLHVVADLTGADVYVREMEPQGSRLQVYFAKR